jgi:hypothetical protein
MSDFVEFRNIPIYCFRQIHLKTSDVFARFGTLPATTPYFTKMHSINQTGGCEVIVPKIVGKSSGLSLEDSSLTLELSNHLSQVAYAIIAPQELR